MDPIADMLTTIRNAIAVRQYEVRVPYAKVKWHILKVCEDLGFVSQLKKEDESRDFVFTIVTERREPKFTSIRRMSTPGRRLYVKWNEIPRASRNGVIIISTSQGMMTGHDARNRHLGGELVCEIS